MISLIHGKGFVAYGHDKYEKKTKLIIKIVIITITILLLIYYISNTIIYNKIRRGDDIGEFTLNGNTLPYSFNIFSGLFEGFPVKILLVEACYYRNVEAVKILLKNGADPNFFFNGDFSSLEATFYSGPRTEDAYQIIKLLIDYGADPNKYGSYYFPDTLVMAIKPSVENYDTKILRLLLDNGLLTCPNATNILHTIILNDNLELVSEMVNDYGWDINLCNGKGKTPLVYTVSYNYKSRQPELSTIETLLSLGADPTIRDNDGKTAYDYAVELGYTEIAEILKPIE